METLYKKRRSAFKDKMLQVNGVGSKTPFYLIQQHANPILTTVGLRNFNFCVTDNSTCIGLKTKETFDQCFSQAVTNLGLANDTDTRIVVTSETAVMRFKNQSELQAEVCLYVLKVKRDIPDEQSVQSIISNGFNDVGFVATSNQPPGVELFMNPRFSRYFNIMKKKTFYLDPTAERKFKIKSNKIYSKSKKYQSTTSYTELRGAEVFFVTVNGSLVHDTTTRNNINYGVTSLDVHFSKTVTFYLGSKDATTGVALADTDTAVSTGEAFILEDIVEAQPEIPA